MLKKEDGIVKNYLKKRKLLEEYNKFYYDKDSPIITDQEYDTVKQETIELEKNYNFLKKYGSINDRVGFKPSSKFTKIKHHSKDDSLLPCYKQGKSEDFQPSKPSDIFTHT